MTVLMKRAGRYYAGDAAIAVWVLVEVCSARVSESAATLPRYCLLTSWRALLTVLPRTPLGT
jgi:hypothetical protein